MSEQLEQPLPRSRSGEARGPLLQRDYWAVISSPHLFAHEFGDLLARRFEEFSPPELAAFTRLSGEGRPLRLGDELRVRIRFTGTFGVRIVHQNANSITLATLSGHPESGRITFGAYQSARGDLIFHIRSRARTSTSRYQIGFLTVGEAMQTNTWTDFIDRIANTVGSGVAGFIYEETRVVSPENEDADEPTYVAEGD